MKDKILEITLLLISLTSWREEKRQSSRKKTWDNKVEMGSRAWIGYKIDVLDEL